MEQDGIIQHELVPFDGQGFVDPDDFTRRIRPNTRMIIVNHGSNVLGTIQPVAEIGRICREKEVIFALDVAQTAGMCPIDMEALNVDVLAFTGHKSLMGPTGIGGMAVGRDVSIRSTRWGGTGVKSAVRTHLEEYPYRCEVGTLNTVGIAGLSEALTYLGEHNMSQIRAKEMKLAQRLIEGFREIDDVTLYCAGYSENHLPVVSCNVGTLEAGEVGTILDVEYDIATRTGLHCAPLVHEGIGTTPKGTVRFSIGPFNTIEHIETAIKAMQGITTFRRV
jgi:selenocysteine lyase/cysteine desulfurase